MAQQTKELANCRLLERIYLCLRKHGAESIQNASVRTSHIVRRILTPTRRWHNQTGYHFLAHNRRIWRWWWTDQWINHIISYTHDANEIGRFGARRPVELMIFFFYYFRAWLEDSLNHVLFGIHLIIMQSACSSCNTLSKYIISKSETIAPLITIISSPLMIPGNWIEYYFTSNVVGGGGDSGMMIGTCILCSTSIYDSFST